MNDIKNMGIASVFTVIFIIASIVLFKEKLSYIDIVMTFILCNIYLRQEEK